MLINISKFGGAMPKVTPGLLPENAAQYAENCKTDRGTLRPYKASTFILNPPKSGVIKTLYHYLDQYILAWNTEVDVASGPVTDDIYNRIYWTGDGIPKLANSAMFTAGGGTDYPNDYFPLGVPAPTTAPSIVVTGTSTTPALDESRAYVFTYVTAFGEEGPPSPISSIVVVGPGQTVTGTFIIPPGGYNIVTKRFYRTVTGSTSTEFRFVADISAATTEAIDEVDADSLGEVLPSTYWDAPPADLKGLIGHPSGFLAGFVGRDLYLSEVFQPHAWPDSYKIPFEHDIVGLGVFGSSILVTTKSVPATVTGVEPSNMTVDKLAIHQSCLSKRGIVNVGNGVAYPSPDGLIVIGAGLAKNATEALYTKEQWEALHPEQMKSAFYDGKFYGFFDSQAIVLDPLGSDVITLNVTATAVYVSPLYDGLYCQIGDDIYQVDANAAGVLGDMLWRSKLFVAQDPQASPGVAKVRAGSYPLTFRLYADGVLVHTQTVADNEPFRLPSGYHFEEMYFEITSSYEVYSVAVASTISELANAVMI